MIVLHCVEVESRAEVDELIEKAWAAGATSVPTPEQNDFSYVRGFGDPDGIQWQVMFIEPRHVIN